MSLVQQKAAQAFATNLTLTPTTATVAGNCLVLLVQHQGNTSVTITDSAGGTWVKAFSTNDLATPATAQRLASIYYRLNAGSITTVTATMGTSSALNVIFMEHSGVTGFRAASGAQPSGSVTSAVADNPNDLVVGLVAWTASSRAESVSAGYTATDPATTSTTYLAGAFRTAAVGGSEGPTWSGISATVGVLTAAFVTTASTAAQALTATIGADKTTGPVAGSSSSGTTVTYTVATAGGNSNTKTYAIAIEYSAKGDYTDTTVVVGTLDDASRTYQASPTFTHTPTGVGKYRARGYATQAA